MIIVRRHLLLQIIVWDIIEFDPTLVKKVQYIEIYSLSVTKFEFTF